MLISWWVLLVVTLYEPRCWTWHERTASRPATTVRLSTSSVNSGSWSSDTPTDNIDIHYLATYTTLQCSAVVSCTLHGVMSHALTLHLRNVVLHPLVLQVDGAPWQGEVRCLDSSKEWGGHLCPASRPAAAGAVRPAPWWPGDCDGPAAASLLRPRPRCQLQTSVLGSTAASLPGLTVRLAARASRPRIGGPGQPRLAIGQLWRQQSGAWWHFTNIYRWSTGELDLKWYSHEIKINW